MFYYFSAPYIILTALLLPSFLFPMDPPKWAQKAYRKTARAIHWVEHAGNTLIGRAVPTQQAFLQTIDFRLLPKDIQQKIIELIGKEYNADTLDEAIFSIRRLSLVNKELNNLFNQPSYCFNLVRHLSMKFSTFDSDIYGKLKLPQAKIQSRHIYVLTNLLIPYLNSPSQELKKIDSFIDEYKINVNYTSLGIHSPLSLAIGYKSLPLVQLLISKGAHPQLFIPKHMTPFSLAASLAKDNETSREIFKFLLKNLPQGTIDVSDEKEMNALCYAIEQKDVETINLLLEAGADPHFNNRKPMTIAEGINDKKIINLLNAYTKK